MGCCQADCDQINNASNVPVSASTMVRFHPCVFQGMANLPANTLISVPSCDGTLSPQTVNSLSGVYVLNQDQYALKTLYDTIVASISGSIVVSANLSSVSIDTSGISISSDVILRYLVDWGTGYTDLIGFGGVSIHDFVNQPVGVYEAKLYAMLRSGNNLLLNGSSILYNGSTATVTSGSPASVNRLFSVTVASYLQRFCGTTPVGSPATIYGSNYPLSGTGYLHKAEILDERFSNADVTLNGGGGGSLSAITPSYNTNTVSYTPNTTPAVATTIAVIANCREIAVQNVTASDVRVVTNLGIQVVAPRSSYTMSEPNNTTTNQAIFTSLAIQPTNSVGGNYLGVAPRVIVNQKGYL